MPKAGGDRIRTERRRSSGGVVFRRRNGRVEVALVLVESRKGRVWCLPKGLVEAGESPESAAVREVREETGLDGKVLEKIDDVRYFYCLKEGNRTVRVLKTVSFFLMEYTGGDTRDHDREVVDSRWFTLDDALESVAYGDERKILEMAKQLLEDRRKGA